MYSDIIKKRKKMNNTGELKIIKIADFVTKNRITRQFVYNYIDKGKIKILELPIYVSYQGQLIRTGTEKFIDLENSEYKGRGISSEE